MYNTALAWINSTPSSHLIQYQASCSRSHHSIINNNLQSTTTTHQHQQHQQTFIPQTASRSWSSTFYYYATDYPMTMPPKSWSKIWLPTIMSTPPSPQPLLSHEHPHSTNSILLQKSFESGLLGIMHFSSRLSQLWMYHPNTYYLYFDSSYHA